MISNLLNIKGKVAVFTDLHLGLKNAAKNRLEICIKAINKILAYCKLNDVKTIIFCGDWHHQRASTDNNVLNVSYKLVQEISKHCLLIMICGNHDSYMKESIDVNSIKIFDSIDNVKIVDSILQILINGKTALLVPWLGDVTKFQPESFDMIFGHFDASHKYIVESYIEDHNYNSCAVSAAISKMLDDDILSINSEICSESIGDSIGNFVDVVKRTGCIFSGHIHSHREFLAKGRKFYMVGSPYQQNLGEKNNICGFYTLDEDNNVEFHEISGIPKHVEFVMSQMIDRIDTFDFSCVTGNIVHKIYDVEVERGLDAKIQLKITDRLPYEELLPDYAVELSSSLTNLQNDSIELIKKSKLDYVRKYIDNIDKDVLKEQNLNSNKLYSILEQYYNKIAIEK